MTVSLNDEQRIKVLNSDSIYSIMREILLRENDIDRDKEHFWLVCLAQNNTILMIELISLGSVNETIVTPMDVFSFALQKRAVKLIMVHNHPSGELRPAVSDIDLTERMLAIGDFVKVPIIEHLIISEKSYYSFADEGIIKKMRKENRYDLSFKEIDELTHKMKEAEVASKKKVLELAKELLELGADVEKVMRLSGLTRDEVEGLGG